VATKEYPTRSGTSMAQGGINIPKSDDIELHIEETLKASGDLADENRVRTLIEGSSEAEKFLRKVGVSLSEDRRGLGGVSSPRTLYSSDYTGLAILQKLYEYARKIGVKFLDEHYLLNLIKDSDKVKGATFLEIRTSSLKEIVAKSTVIATGGYSRLYWGFSTNSVASTGDGVASALRAGAELSNMEFIQFHPTALKDKGILISETARGEGGKLLNSDNERFVDELKPRDVVARAIYQQIESGKDVFLDLRDVDGIREKMPQEMKLIQNYSGLNPENELIPIEPMAHYTMGGIRVNNSGESTIKGLFAVGEASDSGVHGANRLGGNSLLELIVFGKVVAESTSKRAEKEFIEPLSQQLGKDRVFINGVFNFTNQIDFYEKRIFLGKILYRNGGIEREEMRLKGILSVVRQIQKEYRFMGVTDKTMDYNRNLIEFIEFGNLVELAETVLVNAINRIESRGSHYRTDFPKIDNENQRVPSTSWLEDGVLATEFRN
jgi:succinate dehydrogenase / fumarate reductase flavoprotein subunit